MLWDFSTRPDHEIEARRPDLLMIDNKENNCQIIVVALITADGRVRAKEDETEQKNIKTRERNPKDMGRKDKVDTHSGGGIGVSLDTNIAIFLKIFRSF